MSKTHFIQAFSNERPLNIGKTINDAITQLNAADDDWICNMDSDILFLLPDTKAHIMEILDKTDYHILGCLTNRLGSNDQLVMGMFDEDSISAHVSRAKKVWEYSGDKVVPLEVVAAMLMCFRVSTWRALGGFAENRLNFDWLFCSRAPRAGLKVGVMAGVYLLHLYRYGSADPVNDYKHLEI